MNLLDMIKMRKKEPDKTPEIPVYWVETSDSVSRHFQFQPDGQHSMKLLDDARPVYRRVVESFLSKFFPSGYPYSVNEGYLRYTQFRALQHFSSAALSVLSTQSLLFAAGLRPTPAQATAVSWILKDGMQHVRSRFHRLLMYRRSLAVFWDIPVPHSSFWLTGSKL